MLATPLNMIWFVAALILMGLLLSSVLGGFGVLAVAAIVIAVILGAFSIGRSTRV